ncbi:hypothetical protein PEX1_103540 [Penicillium expansum]|uniref:Uncharacterized protein n=1 Tax=Penicillium expansum TaxID=27334 RepID=A0A0A2J1E1_PENEN|nr:hypothetical protein PEX2_030760 [Penicillium expansum]KGO48616.1 hypothetical protein PEXP_073460 [Penicillium expansum]KGO51827.1 hypothetical protein PEX1_103540 [Penicillium expansum]KGO55372.1 hypothetical protein PEX2_030760 [Penicillium expansum]
MALPLYIPLCIHTPAGRYHLPRSDQPLRIQIEGPLIAIQRLLPDIPWRLDLPGRTLPQLAGPELIGYYGVTFDHLVPTHDINPEVLQINIIEIEDDNGIYANTWLSFAIDPTNFIEKKVLAVPRCCQKRKGTQDRWQVNALVDQRVHGLEQLKGAKE